MRKIILTTVCFIFLIFFCGCAKDQYSVEREYWKVKKQAENIFRNPAAAPPNEFERAISGLQKFAQANSDNILAIESQFAIARLYVAKEDFDGARKHLRGMLDKYSKSAMICSETMFYIGNSYEMQNKWDSALDEYRKLTADYPLTTRGLEMPVYIAQYYKVQHRPDKMNEAFSRAIEHYRQLAEKYPASPLAFKAYTLISSCYSATKDWPNAVSTLNLIADKFKDKVRMDTVLMELALIYKKELKEDAKAKETLERLIKEYPDSRFTASAQQMLKS